LSRVDAEIVQNPESAELYIRRAQLHLVEGELDEAAEDLRSAQARGGDVALDLAIVTDDEATLNALLPAPHAKAHAARAAMRAERGELELALEDLNAAVALDPTPERFLSRMRVAEQLDVQDAIDGLGGAPGAVCALEQVRLLRESGQRALAREAVDALLEQSPDHPEWLLLRAELSLYGRPYRKRAQEILKARVQSRPSEKNQALLERSQKGCSSFGTCAGALWPGMLLLLWRRR
jgi:tetratricopeptide (TPR) repeat protein